jgi:nucleoside-diphosphate-sugar epimerase
MMPFKLMNACLNPSRTVDIYDNGEMQRDWTYIDDVIDALIVALKRPLGYEIINIGYGTPIKLTEFIEQMQRVSNRHIHVQLKKSYRTELLITHCDNNKARRLLDFVPKTNVSEGLKKTWLWFQQEYGR